MAEENEDVVDVPRVLEVTEVELEVLVRVTVHARHPVVAVGKPTLIMYGGPSVTLRAAPATL